MGIEKLNFFLVHLVGSNQTKLKLDNKPQTRKQKMVRDKIHLLRKVRKKLYKGDKIILLQKFEKIKIKKLRVKLLLILILNSLRTILSNTYFNFQLFRANKISVESSSFVHCQYCIFKWLSTKLNFFHFLDFHLPQIQWEPRWVQSGIAKDTGS